MMRSAGGHSTTDACFWTERMMLQGHYGRVVKATDSNFANICFPLGAQVQILLVSTFFLLSFSHATSLQLAILLHPQRHCHPLQVRTQGTHEAEGNRG
jgi:hypothetical protein